MAVPILLLLDCHDNLGVIPLLMGSNKTVSQHPPERPGLEADSEG